MSERIRDVVRAVLGQPGAEIATWDAAPMAARTQSVYRIRGVARVGASERPWSVVLKVPTPDQHGPADVADWKREFLLYRSGLLDDLPAHLRAPRCYGADEPDDEVVWLWLEHVREDGVHAWPLGRWALAAQHLGQLNGAFLAGRPLPGFPWLGGQRLRSWLGRHTSLVTLIAAAQDNADVRQWWPQSVVDGVLHLWEEREAFCTALERLPQTFGHGDAIRRNLFSRRGVDGAEETVAIDWEHAGYYAAGEEVGQTLSVAAAFYDVDPVDLPALDEALFAGYLEGLRDAGWRGDPRPVRFAYAAHAALRNAFNAVGATVPDEARRAAARETYGHTWEELAERRAAVRPFLLARADEARKFMGAL